MKNSTPHRGPATAAAPLFALVLAAAAPGQDVLLSEVRADAVERWIELHNRSAAAIDLSSWSLHYATQTPGMPQNYWWPFPAGTVLPAGGFLRVFWFQPAPAAPGAGDLYTGTSPFSFLFGLGGETLHGSAGALALFRSQANAMMNTAAMIEDWVGWGAAGFQREPLAVQAGVWAAGRALPPIPAGHSIARDPLLVGAVALPDLAWFVDPTPTPLGPNTGGAIAEAYGAACALPGHHLLGEPHLGVLSLPLIGSHGFGLTLQHTTGIFGEFALFAFAAAAAPPGTPPLLPPFAGVACQQAIDVTALVGAWIVPAQLQTTVVPLSLAGLPAGAVGAELHVQALVLDLLPHPIPPYQGVSNALRLVVGQ